MSADVFGNLDEWGAVLQKMEQLRSEKLLDEHQPGLARVIRFRQNRRLQQAALECAKEVQHSSDLLIADSLNVLADQDAPLTVRVMAAEVLTRLIPRRSAGPDSTFDMERVLETVRYLAHTPQAPILQRALDETLSIPIQMT